MSKSRRLLLLRHAKAVTALPGMADSIDHARVLADRGRADAAAMGQLLRERALRPDIALVSTSARTRETYTLLQPFDGPEPRLILSDALYLASADTLLDALRDEGDEAGSILLVGHNPGLHELALDLSGGDHALQRGFPTCALAAFKVKGEWASLARAHASFLGMLRP